MATWVKYDLYVTFIIYYMFLNDTGGTYCNLIAMNNWQVEKVVQYMGFVIARGEKSQNLASVSDHSGFSEQNRFRGIRRCVVASHSVASGNRVNYCVCGELAKLFAPAATLMLT